MDKPKRKPSRRDLLIVIGRLQWIFGRIASAHSDQNPNRASDIERLWKQGHDLCIDASSHDDPVAITGPWAGN